MNDACPATAEWLDSSAFRVYYLVDHTQVPFVHEPSSRLEQRWVIDGQEHARFENALWRRLTAAVVWRSGPLAGLTDPYTFLVSHLHADFNLEGHEVHVDFVRFFRAGPQTSYREYRVFVDGEQAGRGGGFRGFLGGSFGRTRCWPLAARFNNGLVYVDDMLCGWTSRSDDPDALANALSVWVLESEPPPEESQG